MKPLSLIAATLILFTSLPVTRAQSRGSGSLMTPADTLRVGSVSDAQISPNGQWVVYTVANVGGDETVNTLWLARVAPDLTRVPTNTTPPTEQRNRAEDLADWRPVSGSPQPLLRPDWRASNPRWSPDSSKIAFLTGREGQRELRFVTLEKREPQLIATIQSTNFFITYAGESFAWAPDSRRLAFISATEERSTPVDPPTTAVADPRVIDRLQYKSRTSFSDDRRPHVWITNIDRPEPRQLTSGLYYDHALAFNPNGNQIAFLSNREPDPDVNNNSDIFTVDLNGDVSRITETKGCEYEPSWSPDGKSIAYTATKREITTIDSVAEDTHVWVRDVSSRTSTELAALDRRARNPRWSSDSKWIFFLANDRGRTKIYRVDPSRPFSGSEGVVGFPFGSTSVKDASGNSVELPFPVAVQVSSFSVGPVARLTGMPLVAFTMSDWSHPAELWAAVFGRSETGRRLTAHNDGITRSFDFVRPELLTFKSFDGTRIEGWLMKPAGWRADRKYPLILSIHGGPHGMYGVGFSSTFQAYSARGYAVLFLNPRGSSGYGQRISDGTLNEWGGGDYKDLMAGVDEALRKYSWIDQSRMGVTGGSYGGFMTNWIITQTPRFKAAVAVASLSNLISFYSTSLYQDLIHAEFGGFPWDNYELLWQWSPLKYIKQAQTPTLFIHGEQDNDVHITQAEEMYMGLKRRGVESVLVRYPREGHGLREPRHRVDAMERTLAWFDRFLR